MKRFKLAFAALFVAGVAGYLAVPGAVTPAVADGGNEITVSGEVLEASSWMTFGKKDQGEAERKLVEEGQPLLFKTERNASYTLFFPNNGDRPALRKRALECVGKLSILKGRDYWQWNYHMIEVKELSIK
jgi:hypothetical protein